MKFLYCVLASLTLLGSLFAQGETAGTSEQDRGPYEARLTVPELLLGTEAFEVTLQIEFFEEVKVPQTVLSGVHLVFLDGTNEVGKALERREGTAEMAAGTILQRKIQLDPTRVFEGLSFDSYRELRVSWPGLSGARGEMRLTPDQSDLDIDSLDLAKTTVRMITVKGEIVLEFWPDVAPGHVRNFLKLSADGFYNGTRFHRILKGFVIQGGCPNTKPGATGQPGTGNPGYSIDAEFNTRKHVPGVLSMARNGNDVNSAGCQFFIVQGEPAPALDNIYTGFGRVRSGMDVVDALANTSVRPLNSREISVPAEDLWVFAAIVEPVFKKND